MTQPVVAPANADAYYLSSPALIQQRLAEIWSNRGLDPSTVPGALAGQIQLGGATFDNARALADQQAADNKVNPGGVPAGAGMGQGTAARGVTDAQNTAASVESVLRQAGLDALIPQVEAWAALGWDNSAILSMAQTTPEWKQRFAGNEQLVAKGETPLTPSQYLNYEQTARQLIRQAGLPQGVFDTQQYLAGLIGRGVGLPELQARIQKAQQEAYDVPQAARDFAAQNYGWNTGHLAAMFLDPNVAEPVLERQARAADIGGQAMTTGYGDIGGNAALHLADLGVTQEQAQQGFGTLAHDRQLFNPLPAEGGAQTIGQDQQIAAAFEGNANAQQRIQTQADRRKAAFGGGGSFVQSSGGFSGVGASQSA